MINYVFFWNKMNFISPSVIPMMPGCLGLNLAGLSIPINIEEIIKINGIVIDESERDDDAIAISMGNTIWLNIKEINSDNAKRRQVLTYALAKLMISKNVLFLSGLIDEHRINSDDLRSDLFNNPIRNTVCSVWTSEVLMPWNFMIKELRRMEEMEPSRVLNILAKSFDVPMSVVEQRLMYLEWRR